VSRAQQFLGDRYSWGGRSPTPATPRGALAQMTGVDCSGLVNLAYRAIGVELPRDAHEQFLRARRVAAPEVGDLVFLSEPHHPERIVHVMLYAGAGEVIEAPGTGLAVRRLALAARLDRPIERLAPGDVVHDQTVFFGRYLPD
jgi:cell wall-associated NlpC family hydrolase